MSAPPDRLTLSDAAAAALRRFAAAAENAGHFDRERSFGVTAAELADALDGADRFVRASAAACHAVKPRRVLDLGCSIGMKVLALARHFPDAEIVGLDIEEEALEAGRALASCAGLANVRFVRGAGEDLPFPPAHFDFVVCHTTIEHVADVDRTVRETARVLTPGGALHLVAPNYRFPLEPHLGVWCVPEFGKGHIALMARLQGVSGAAQFLPHLKLVTGPWLERAMRSAGLSFRNLSVDKLRALARGDEAEVAAFRAAARALDLARRVGLAGAAAGAAAALRVYPSLAYAAHKPCAA